MSRRHMGLTLIACFVLSTGLALGVSSASAAEAEPGEKLPRFVSLRSDQVNLRVGPGENYPIQWVLTRKEMHVDIIKEFEHWRMILDGQGSEGWVHESMVSGKRTIVVKGAIRALRRQPDVASQVVARAEAGVCAHLVECRGDWCRIETADITGWIQRSEIWGVYPDEAVQ
jgi:SH3-like domain-containing protein